MTALTASYTSVAADVTAVAYVQCDGDPASSGIAEILVAASAPSAGTAGLILRPGETVTTDQLTAIAATGAVYARAWAPGGTANVANVRVIAAS